MIYSRATAYGVDYNLKNNNQLMSDSVPNAETQDALADENAETAQKVGPDASFTNIAVALAVVAGLVVFFGVGR